MGAFQDDLDYSNSEDPFIVESIKAAFPDEPDLTVDFNPRKIPRKQDLDIVLNRDGGQVRLTVDYKLGRKPYCGLVTLEDVSNDSRWSQGWTHRCWLYNYILYVWPMSRLHVLLPAPALFRAWKDNRLQWVRQYKYTIGENPTYNTLCVKVPTQLVQTAMEPYSPRCASGCGRIVGKYSTACSVCGVKTCCQGMGTWTCASPACKK